jgi:hypothetical protein
LQQYLAVAVAAAAAAAKSTAMPSQYVSYAVPIELCLQPVGTSTVLIGDSSELYPQNAALQIQA